MERVNYINPKPCPFCGSKKIHADGWWNGLDGDESKGWNYMICSKCCAHGGLRDTHEEAMEAWNTRA